MTTSAAGSVCPRDLVALEFRIGAFRCPVCGDVWSAVKRWGRLEPDLSEEEVEVVESCGVGLGRGTGRACRCARQLGHAGGHYCAGGRAEDGAEAHHAHAWGT